MKEFFKGYLCGLGLYGFAYFASAVFAISVIDILIADLAAREAASAVMIVVSACDGDSSSVVKYEMQTAAYMQAAVLMYRGSLMPADSSMTPSKNGWSCDVNKAGGNSNQTLLSGEEWYRYFQGTYGVDNVNWNISSFDDMLNHPTSLRGYSADEIGQILGDGWTRSTYGSNGSGWKFIEDAHPDNMVFYHGGGGVHEGAYWGVKSGKTGTIKIVNTSTYVPLPKDKAVIVYGKDW